MTPNVIKRAIEAFVGAKYEGDKYAEPINASIDCWTNVADHVVSDIMISGGGGELFIDDISAFARVLERAFAGDKLGLIESGVEGELGQQRNTNGNQTRLKFVVTERASHEQMILDHYFFWKKRKENGSREIETWLQTVLSS